uniref:Uncharacterized protein n=1 Tax=Sphaerodactylus townsendi TaxID=933632 RepID=A0ACB8GAM3_9SAUR
MSRILSRPGLLNYPQNPYCGSNKRLPPEFFVQNLPLNSSPVFVNDHEVTQDFRLPPGVYVIVPATSEPHQESEFLLRIFSRKHNLREIGGNSSPVLSKEIVDKYDDKIWDDYFTKYFEQHPEINVVQLQRLLNMAWTNLQNNGVWFSLDACRSILAVLDKVFQKKDTYQTGTLGLEELPAAMKEIGISLSDEVSNLMVLRYGDPDLKISFQSFVCFMLRVEFIKEAFCNLTQDGKGIYLQEYEWMMMTLYS